MLSSDLNFPHVADLLQIRISISGGESEVTSVDGEILSIVYQLIVWLVVNLN